MSSKRSPTQFTRSQPSRRSPSRPTAVALLAWLLVPALLTVACGKKGDPQPPLRTSPQTTTKLTVSQRGGDLLLEFPYPTTTSAGQALDGVERVEIYRLVQPVAASQLDLFTEDFTEGETSPDAVPVAPSAADAAPNTDTNVEERTEADEPREPASTDFYAEVGIEAADEVDEMEAQREVGEEMSQAAETVTDDVTDEADAPAPPSRRARLRELLKPVDRRQFEGGAELIQSVLGDDLQRAVTGGNLILRLPLEPAMQDSETQEAPGIHYLGIRTVGPSGEPSDLSNQAVLVPRSPPAAPRGLDAQAQAGGIQVEWEPQGEVVGYNLYRRNARSRLFDIPVAVPPGDRVNYLDRTARYGETYVYAVTAVAQRDPLVESAVTQVREVDYQDRFPPPAPSNVVALAEDDRVRLVWRGSESDDLAGYQVSRRVGSGDFQSLTSEPQSGTEYIDGDVSPGQNYTYRVEAVDENGNVSDSASASTEAR